MASFQKNFVVKNGLEVGLNGETLKADDLLVGIANTNPTSTLDVNGNVQVSGIATFTSDLRIGGNLYVTGSEVIIDTQTLRVEDKNIVLGFSTSSSPSDSYADGGGIEIAGATDSSIISGLTSSYKTITWYNKSDPLFSVNQRVGIGTSVATGGSYFDVAGKFQVFKYGDVNIGSGLTVTKSASIQGNAQVKSLGVTGVSTFTGAIDANGDLDVDGHTELDNVNISGITTLSDLNVQGDFDVYATEGTFHNNLVVQGNFQVNGTQTAVNVSDLNVLSKDIVLGIGTTPGLETDFSANHGGIAVASTEGSPLISLKLAGVNTHPDTYKQIMWVKSDTFGAGTTDAWLFNYAVGIGSTQVPDGVRLAVNAIQFTDDTINTPNLDVTGSATFSGLTIQNDFDVDGHTELDDVNISGIVTAFDLDVDGHTELDNTNVSGILTALNISATDLATTNLVTNGLSVSGISTFNDDVRIGADDKKLKIGDGNDINIYHSGGVNYIEILSGQSLSIKDNVNTRAVFQSTGAVDLYYGTGKKFETIGAGVTVTGTTFTNQLSVSGISTFNNLNVTGVSTFNGNLNVIGNTVELSNNVNIRKATGGNLTASFDSGGQTTLYYDGSQKLQTQTNGVVVNGRLTAQTSGELFAGSLDLDSVSGGNGNLKASSGISTLGITSTTTLNVSGVSTFNSFINASTIVSSSNLNLNNITVAISTDVSVGRNANVVGIVTAGFFVGDGSLLTNVPAGGTPGSNTQVVFNNNGNFGASSNFTFNGTGILVAGISTFNSSIDANGDLDVDGHTELDNVNISGIVTAFDLDVNGHAELDALNVSGIATAQDFDSLSDFRYKTDITTVSDALSKVNDLRGVRFNWKESGLPSYGVVAQELEEILPELVHGNDPKTVNYNGIIGILIEAVKELSSEVEELKKKSQ